MEASEDNADVVCGNVGDEAAPVEVSHDPQEDMEDKGVEGEGAEGNETKLCRVCFDDDETEENPLISPCICIGSQKYIHLECLRGWQQSVQLSQPNHPAASSQERRHLTCSVCRTDFTIRPPGRMDILSNLSGVSPALIKAGLLIVATDSASAAPGPDIPLVWQVLIEVRRAHWVKSVYLMIATVTGSQISGEDEVKGINITRAITEESPSTGVNASLAAARAKVEEAFPADAASPHRTPRALYFVGGPVAPSKATAVCIVKSQGGLEAFEALGDEGDLIYDLPNGGGKLVHGDLEDIIGIVAEEIDAGEAGGGRGVGGRVEVNVFVGHAAWSRGQLMGEVARGSWGVMTGDTSHMFPSLEIEGEEGREVLRCRRLWDELLRGGEVQYALENSMQREFEAIRRPLFTAVTAAAANAGNQTDGDDDDDEEEDREGDVDVEGGGRGRLLQALRRQMEQQEEEWGTDEDEWPGAESSGNDEDDQVDHADEEEDSGMQVVSEEAGEREGGRPVPDGYYHQVD